MKTVKFVPSCLFLVLFAIISLPWSAALADCPGNLADRADVAANPAGADYDVYFTDDSLTSVDYFPRTRAEWVRDALVNSHNIYLGTPHNFRPPYFNDSPNDTCIFDSANTASAPHGRITVDSPHLRASSEPFIRSAVAHELFHHVQYSYINYNDWPSWGGWTVEGTARLMEDKITLDNDITPNNTWYVGEVNGYLADPNRTLMSLSYPTALFWNYLTEQLGTPFAEPARGVDVIERFWRATDGHDPDSIHYLRQAIHHFDPDLSLEAVFRDFAITNYTHNLDVSTLAEPDRYRYFDETAAGGGTAYDAVARTSVSTFNTALTSDVVRWGARYFEVNVPAEKQCDAIGFWGRAKDDRTLSWAVIGVKAANKVTDIYKGSGNSFYRAVINSAADPYEKLALVVIGRNDSADFDYAFGWGDITGEVRLPTMDNKAFVGARDDPERFQVRLLLQGPPVLTPSGTGTISMKGVDASELTVTLRNSDTGHTYPAEIINSSYVSGEYWLVVQAPSITDPGDSDIFDLEICVCELGADCAVLLASSKSVSYGMLTRNQMLVVDRSYSMHYPVDDSKIDAAKNAARLYVNAAAGDDRLGLVTFTGDDDECNHDAKVNFELKQVFGNRPFLIDEIDRIEEDGWTSIGDGLKDGRDELLNATTPADRHALVLLSDGLENEGDYWGRSHSACSAPAVKDSFDPDMAGAIAADVRIDTVAFGADADQGLLQAIATFTGGDYYYVSTDSPTAGTASSLAGSNGSRALLGVPPPIASLHVPNRLAQVYRSIEEATHDQDRLFYEAHAVSAGVDLTFSIPVTEKAGGGVQDAVFAFNWNVAKGSVKIELRDPHGTLIQNPTAGWTLLRDRTNATFHYDDILATGDWEVTIQSDTDLQLIALLSGRIRHGVDIALRFSQVKAPVPSPKCEKKFFYDFLRGLPVAILVNISDAKGGIEGLEVIATIENPDGSSNRLSLYDDGGHDDGLAGDGIYGNLYTRTYWYSNGGVPDYPDGPPLGDSGSYNVTVAVRGESNYGEKFQRFVTRSFQVFDFNTKTDGAGCQPDTDGDGLPDRWEDLYGLNKANAADASQDPDGDGIKNKDEFFNGTLPRSPDSDLGGEADGTEVKNGRDPLFDQDDLLPPIIDYGIVSERGCVPVHEPQPNTNILHFPVNPSYKAMEIWRTTPGSLGYSRIALVDLKSNRSGVYYDKKLTNGKKYHYYLVARGESGAKTARTAVFSGIPKADPLPPKGWVKINRGATRTDSLKVRLLLDTSDDATQVKISQKPDLSGAAWQTLKAEMKFTLADPGIDPFVATVYVKFRDAALNVSTLYSDSIIVDRYGDFDGDGIANYLDGDDDKDGLKDTHEWYNAALSPFGYDPFNPDSDGNGVKDSAEDYDRDLLSNALEIKRGLNPGHNLADVNHDDKFTKEDVTLFNAWYKAKDPRADVNGDGKLGAADKTAFQKAYDNELKYRETTGGP